MKVYSKSEIFLKELHPIRAEQSIGFVPTMGALHNGHLSLIEKAKKENDIVVVSIFVNPTQFDRKEDLDNYPRTLDNDLKLLTKAKCDYVFTPSAKEIYSKKIKSQRFDFSGLEQVMEGKFRSGHFDGVGTIVKLLLETVLPTRAYFGEKDFQQLQIIRKLVADLKMPIKIVGCKIFREDDGLAMSSRNSRLTKEHRKVAPTIYKTLKQVRRKFEHTSISDLNKFVKESFAEQALLNLEYFTIADEKNLRTARIKSKKKNYRAFIAVFAGDIRLIDNITLN